MKKNILFTLLFALTALVTTSCSKDSEGLSRITYYPIITLNGDANMTWEKGEAFVDPGFYSEMNGEDVTSQVSVSGTVDVNKSGVYKLTYSIMNEDGINATETRTVVVLDSSNNIEGYYLNQATSDRNGTPYGKDFEVLVIDNGDGTISVDDILGGWYCQRAGYGTNYAMTADIAVAADGTLTLINSYVPGWADGLDSFEGTYDAANQIIKFVCVYAGSLKFNETWVKE
jgi:hypothetical protein